MSENNYKRYYSLYKEMSPASKVIMAHKLLMKDNELLFNILDYDEENDYDILSHVSLEYGNPPVEFVFDDFDESEEDRVDEDEDDIEISEQETINDIPPPEFSYEKFLEFLLPTLKEEVLTKTSVFSFYNNIDSVIYIGSDDKERLNEFINTMLLLRGVIVTRHSSEGIQKLMPYKYTRFFKVLGNSSQDICLN